MRAREITVSNHLAVPALPGSCLRCDRVRGEGVEDVFQLVDRRRVKRLAKITT